MLITEEKAAKSVLQATKYIMIHKNEVKDDTRKLFTDTNIDDGTMGGTKSEVQRMIGYKLPDGTFFETISTMMEKVVLKLKTIVSSNSQDNESIDKISDKVLGYLFDQKEDMIGVKFTFNPSKKKKGAKIKIAIHKL